MFPVDLGLRRIQHPNSSQWARGAGERPPSPRARGGADGTGDRDRLRAARPAGAVDGPAPADTTHRPLLAAATARLAVVARTFTTFSRGDASAARRSA